MLLRSLILFYCFFLAQTASAQNAAAWIKNGSDLLAKQQYKPALESFQLAIKHAPPDAETLTNIGICYFHLHQPEEAEEQLLAASQAKKKLPPINFLYLAKIHQARLEFEKAAAFYKQFLKKTPSDHPWRSAVKDEIKRCATGLRVRRQAPHAAVLPLVDINTSGDEFKPLPSPSGKEQLYFSAKGRSNTATDIFSTEVKAGDWSAPKPLSRFVNSANHEIALGFNESGTNLYFFRGETTQYGQILVDSFRENPLDRTLFFEPFLGPMHPAAGDCEPFFFNDSILIFASSRVGGFGGLDLYWSILHDDSWTPAVNLGPVINSAYDETSPFLARDGRTLYFSSNDAARSFGGMDVLRATWLNWSANWSPPINLGPPINSSLDDIHFTLAYQGDRAFFDSDRITGSGGHDLFVALYDQPREWQLSESQPVAFCLAIEGEVMSKASELAVQPKGELSPWGAFDEITAFDLPVMALPPPGGTPGEQTVNQFALLAQLLKKYPKLQLTIALHAAVGDAPMGAFSFASQTATDLLRQEGIRLERVTLLFAGSSFPIAEGDDQLNRRAEVFIDNPTVLPFKLRRPALPSSAYKAQFFQKSMTSLAYRVNVDIGREGVDLKGLSKLFALYPDGILERRAGTGTLVFSPGLYLTHASATEWRNLLVLDGYPTAAAEAMLRGRELPKEEARKYVNDFPDLKHYIEN